MPLSIDTVNSLLTRSQKLADETVQADYSYASSKAIKENLLKNFGFWSRTKLSGALSSEQTAGRDTLGRLGAALSRKPMGEEGKNVLKVIEQVNKKSMSVTNAMAEIGKLERQFAASHPNAQDVAARAFFTTARKVVLMAPMVAREIPAKMKEAPKAIADIASQYERLERVFSADTLQEVDDLRSIFNWQLQLATQAGDSELSNATQMIMVVLENKRALLQELANVSSKLSTGIPNAQTLQEAGDALQAMAEACLVDHGERGELHDLGRASLIGAVQNGLKEFYSATHRRDMARIATLQAQIDQIDFANDLTVDWTSVDGLDAEISNVDDKWYTQEMVDEGAAALQKLKQSAQMKSLLVRMRSVERDFASGKSIGNAPLKDILAELGAIQAPDHEKTTRDAIEFHGRKLWDAMNAYSTDRVRKPLAALNAELTATRGVEQARECGRKIEAELNSQLEFLLAPDAPVSPKTLETLRKDLKDMSGAAIMRECDLVMESIEAKGRHTLQELADSLVSQPHLDQDTVKDVQEQIKDTSSTSQKAAARKLDDLEQRIRNFIFGENRQSASLFARLQTMAEVISSVRADAARTMLAEERAAVEDKCGKMEEMLASLYTDTMVLLPDEERAYLSDADKQAVGMLCRLGGFDTKLASALLKLGCENQGDLQRMTHAVNDRLDGKPGSTMKLFELMDKLLEKDPDVAPALLQLKLKLAGGMDEKKVRLLHDAVMARHELDRTIGEPTQNLSMHRLGLYYFKETITKSSLFYMLGKIGMAGKNRPSGLNMAVLKHLWLDELTKDMTDDSPLPDVKARFAAFQEQLPEPFKSDKDLFAAMSFDAKELRFVEDFGKSLADLSKTMDGARELQSAIDACAEKDDVFAAQKALESLTRRYANCTSASSDQLMQTGTSVRKGLFTACEKLPDELASAFQIEGEPTEEQQAAMEAFAEKAEELRGASVLLTARAKRQQAACAAIVGDVANMEETVQAVKTVDGKSFNPQEVSGATLSVCILALKTAVKGMADDLWKESHASTAEARKAASKRVQTRYNLLAYTSFPEGMKLSTMTSRLKVSMDEEAKKLEALRQQVYHLPDGAEAEKTELLRIAQEIEQFLANGKYEEKALAVLAHKNHGHGSAQKVWDHAFSHAKLSGERFAAERDMIFALFPQEIAGKAVRARMAEQKLSAAAKEDFEAAKKSLAETTRAFGSQVRKTLSDAVQIAVADTFLRSDPPLKSASELRKQIRALPDQRALREMPFFRQCQETLREKLAVPDSVSTNLLIQFFSNMDDRVFQNMARHVSTQGVQTFLMDLSAADRAPVERLLHREDTLRRTTALISSMTEPDAMVTIDLGMTRGSSLSAVAGHVTSGSMRRARALEAGMAVRREGPEFVVTLSPYATGKMGKSVQAALIQLENAAARAEGQFRDGMELHFENGEKCAAFLADLLSGELQMSSFQSCSAVDLLGRQKDYSLASQRVDITG